MTLFIATFSTLLAIINPLEALPVFLQMAARKDDHLKRNYRQGFQRSR